MLWVVPAVVCASALGVGNSWWSHTQEVRVFAVYAFEIAAVLWGIATFRHLPIRFGSAFFLLLVALFLFLYRVGHAPLAVDGRAALVLHDYWWQNLIWMAGLASLLGMLLLTPMSFYWVTGAFCFSVSGVGVAFCIATFFLPGVELGEAVYNVFEGCMINRAGVMNLLIMFPIFWGAFTMFTKGGKWWKLTVLVVSYLLVAGLGFAHQSRTVLLVLFVVVPLSLGVAAFLPRREARIEGNDRLPWKKVGVFGVLGLLILIAINGFAVRAIPLNIFSDGRFTVYFSMFWEQFSSNPAMYSVLPANGQPWFHNFFADMHRSSGLGALALSFVLVVWIVGRCVQWALREDAGRVGLGLLIPLVLVLLTSVVPEGEFQPLLLLLLLGGASEAQLAKYSRIV